MESTRKHSIFEYSVIGNFIFTYRSLLRLLTFALYGKVDEYTYGGGLIAARVWKEFLVIISNIRRLIGTVICISVEEIFAEIVPRVMHLFGVSVNYWPVYEFCVKRMLLESDIISR